MISDDGNVTQYNHGVIDASCEPSPVDSDEVAILSYEVFCRHQVQVNINGGISENYRVGVFTYAFGISGSSITIKTMSKKFRR